MKTVENDSVEVGKELSQDLQMIVEDPSNVVSVKDGFKCIFGISRYNYMYI